MDNIFVNFNYLPSRRKHLKHDKPVSTYPIGNEKAPFVCLLACTSCGEKLKHLIFLKKKNHDEIVFFTRNESLHI